MKLGLNFLLFWLAYFTVTLVGIGYTILNWKVLKIGVEKAEINSLYDILSYAKTVPFYPPYNIAIWPIFAYVFLVQANYQSGWRVALLTGASWTLITILFDLLGWVIIKHPWSMTYEEMHLDYQPWISLIYLSIFVVH